MTRTLGGGSFRPPGDGDAVVEPSSPSRDELYIPRHLLRDMRFHTVPDGDLEYVQLRRQTTYQYLVRRYMIQIRFGCKEKNCTVPTCFSCVKRSSKPPPRRPTPITARTLAFHLASRNNATAGLCPHEPEIPPDSLNISQGEIAAHVLRPLHHTGGLDRLTISDERDASASRFEKGHEESRQAEVDTPISGEQRSQATNGDEGDKVVTTKRTGRDRPNWLVLSSQKKKDRRSLAQSLFDTLSTRIFEWWDFEPQVNDLEEKSRFHQKSHRPSATPDKELVNGHGDTTVETAQIESSDSGTWSEQMNGYASKDSCTTNSSEPLANGSPLKSIPNGFPRQKSHDRIQNSNWPGKENRRSIDQDKDDQNMKGKGARLHEPMQLDGDVSDGSASSTVNLSTASPQPHHEEAVDEEFEIRCDTDINYKLDHDPQFSTLLVQRITDRQMVMRFLNEDIMTNLFRLVKRIPQGQGDANHEPMGFHAQSRPIKESEKILHDFVFDSLYHGLGHTEGLLRSFRSETRESDSGILPHQDPIALYHSFNHDWKKTTGAFIFDSLWLGLAPCLNRPPCLTAPQALPKQLRTRDSKRPPFISDKNAAHMIMIAIYALTSSVHTISSERFIDVSQLRSLGNVMPNMNGMADLGSESKQLIVDIIESLEYEPAIRLAERIAQIFANRRCFFGAMQAMAVKQDRLTSEERSDWIQSLPDVVIQHLTVVEKEFDSRRDVLGRWSISAVLFEYMRMLIFKNWDGKSQIKRWTVVGGAIETIASMYAHRRELDLPNSLFESEFFADRLDATDAASDFIQFSKRTNMNVLHILQYPFLFPPQQLVVYFRTINFQTMAKAYEFASYTKYLVDRISYMSKHDAPTLDRFLKARLSPALSRYLVLDVRRDHMLVDAFDALWGRERRELLRPLKVQMGSTQGEEGVDHGGVSQEFLRLAIGKALNPDYGMFTIDSSTHMTWFQPASIVPPHRFELVGLLFSLAIYNGITLPVTFPSAFYRFLLGDVPAENLTDIADGWPSLTQGLGELLEYDGDVENDICRSYVFTIESAGVYIDVDITAFSRESVWPAGITAPPDLNRKERQEHLDCEAVKTPLTSSSWRHPYPSSASAESLEAPLVTNATREQYVKDYIHWLTVKSVAPQLRHFARGLFTCISPPSFKMLTPTTLRTLIEGHVAISLPGLRAATRYEDGYTSSHPSIKTFWDILESWDQSRLRKLLEFVTASDRVPVNGEQSLVFCIVRNGSDTDGLPTAMTCFGKLLLPEYGSAEKMRKKLEVAVENCRGFGSA